jgi:hypothetical protein
LLPVDLAEPSQFAFNQANTLLAVGADTEAVVLDLADGRAVARVEGIDSDQFEFLGDRLLVLLGGECALFDPHRREFETLFTPPSHPSCVTVDPTGRLLAVGVSRGLVLYDLGKREVTRRVETFVIDGAPWSPCFSPGGRFVAVDFLRERTGGFLVVWDATDGRRWLTHEITGQGDVVVAFRGDTLAFAFGQSAGLELYEPERGDDPVAAFSPPTYPAAAAFRDGGKTLVAVGYRDGLVEIDVATGRQRRVVDRPGGREVGHSYPSPDWSLIASATEGGVLVWPSGLAATAGKASAPRRSRKGAAGGVEPH